MTRPSAVRRETQMERDVLSPAAAAADRADEARRSAMPLLPRTFVPRLQLWERLEESADCAVTLLVGPGGSGKTLGVAGWLRDRGADGPGQTDWVHADESWTAERLALVLDAASAAGRADGRPGAGPRRVVIDDAQSLPAASMRLIDQRLTDDPTS